MVKSSSAPVAFFDSGIGGLTAVSSFLEKLPSENIVYSKRFNLSFSLFLTSVRKYNIRYGG